MTSDEQLLLGFRQGSRDAFTESFHRCHELIYELFRRRLNDATRADELAQETFLAVRRGIARYEPRAFFRSYVYGIAFNLLSAARRRLGVTWTHMLSPQTFNAARFSYANINEYRYPSRTP